MVLITLVQLDEIAAPAPHTHDEVAIFLGMFLRVKQFLKADGVELQLMSAEYDEGADKLAEFHDCLFVAEDALVELQSQRSAVDYLLQMRLGKRLDDGERAFLADEQRR